MTKVGDRRTKAGNNNKTYKSPKSPLRRMRRKEERQARVKALDNRRPDAQIFF